MPKAERSQKAVENIFATGGGWRGVGWVGGWGRVRGRNGKMSDHSRLSKVETNDSEETVRLVELWLKHASLLGKR